MMSSLPSTVSSSSSNSLLSTRLIKSLSSSTSIQSISTSNRKRSSSSVSDSKKHKKKRNKTNSTVRITVLVPPPQPNLPLCPIRFKPIALHHPHHRKRVQPVDDPDPDFIPIESVSSEEDEDDHLKSEEKPDSNDHQKNNKTKKEQADTPTTIVVLPMVYKRFKPYFSCLRSVSNDTLDPINHHLNERCTSQISKLKSSIPLYGFPHQNHRIDWLGDRPRKVSTKGEEYYDQVQIQNHIIKIGCVVSCTRETGHEFSYKKSRLTAISQNYGSDTEDEDEDEVLGDHGHPDNRQSSVKEQSSRSNVRLFLVRALFERDRVKYFHGTWLEQASHSFIGEAAEPRELLLVDQCYEIALQFVSSIEHVNWITRNHNQPSPKDSFYCRFHWKPSQACFVDLPRVPKPKPPNPVKDSTSLCSICVSIPTDFEWLSDPSNGQISLGLTDQYEALGFTLRGEETYRLNDFVKVQASFSSEPQLIGQIIEICGIRANPNSEKTIVIDEAPFHPPPEVYSKLINFKRRPIITIRLYRRSTWYGTATSSSAFKDDRRLWISAEEQLVDVKSQLQGKCEIVHLIKHKTAGCVTLGTHRQIDADAIAERDNCFYSILPTRKQQRHICSVPLIDKAWKNTLIDREPEWVKDLDDPDKTNYQALVKDYGYGKLRHLELFAGMGSMSVALMEIGLTSQDDTMFIDISIPACQTIARNFPRSKVICADVNELLELMVKRKIGDDQNFLIDKRTGQKISVDQLPSPGDFDLITAGFPCGSHSTLNVLRKANDPKNALCATALSYIAYFKPDYLFFENVRGLLKTSFINPLNEKVLTKAFLRLICGTLVSLGYQVRFGVLQAAQFGSPQGRRRIIFSGTRHGLTSIKLPEPTHHFPDDGLAILLPPNDGKGEHRGALKADYRKSTSGPLKAITIKDTISDLPEFEYINPNQVMSDSENTKIDDHDNEDDDYYRQEIMEGRPELMPQLKTLVSFSSSLNGAKISLIGFDEFEYATKPANRYQAWLRKPLEWKPLIDTFIPKRNGQRKSSKKGLESFGLDCRIRNWHATPKFSARVTERICHIPFKPNADHRALPKPLRLKNLHRCFKLADFDGNYGRLGFNNQFQTIITKIHPQNQGKCGTVLHPNQNRTLSLLEVQRAQGFPDRYKLEPALGKSGVNQSINHQLSTLIGNAIPIPITMSLGKSLLMAREADFSLETRRLKKEGPSDNLDPTNASLGDRQANVPSPDLRRPRPSGPLSDSSDRGFEYLKNCLDCQDLFEFYLDQ